RERRNEAGDVRAGSFGAARAVGLHNWPDVLVIGDLLVGGVHGPRAHRYCCESKANHRDPRLELHVGISLIDPIGQPVCELAGFRPASRMPVQHPYGAYCAPQTEDLSRNFWSGRGARSIGGLIYDLATRNK